MTDETVKKPHRITRAEKGEVIGGGFFVARRDRKGRVLRGQRPFEHPTHESAFGEAERLAGENPGTLFVVLQVVDAIAVPKPAVEAA
jgi:hypothetical protein